MLLNKHSFTGGRRFHSLDPSSSPTTLPLYPSTVSTSKNKTNSYHSSYANTQKLPSIGRNTQESKRSIFRDMTPYEPVQRYQQYFNMKQSNYSKILQHKHRRPVNPQKNDKNIFRVQTDIETIAHQLKSLKDQLKKDIRTKQEKQQQRLLTELTQEMKYHHSMKMAAMYQQPPPPPVPIYIPIMQPMMPPPYYPHEHKSTRKNQGRLNKNKKMRRLWKKAVHAVLFPIYLKKFCKRSQNARMLAFNKFYKQLPKRISTVRTMITSGVNTFFSALQNVSERSLEIKKGDNSSERQDKIKMVRKLVGNILKGVLEKFQNDENERCVTQSLYYLCKHGNYSCSEPILTKQQLQSSCISQKFKYISADSHLQKSSILSLLLAKLLIFNTLLSKSTRARFQSSSFPKHTSKNLYLISSVLYSMLISYQNHQMRQIPSFYQLGNYKDQVTARGLASMVVTQEGEEEEWEGFQGGELISGLKGREWAQNVYGTEKWKEEKKMLEEIVGIQHQRIKSYHKRLIQRFY